MSAVSCNSETTILDLNLIPVRNKQEFSYIDKEGNIAIPPQFSDASVFREGIALVKTLGENQKWGYINNEGKYIIPANYKEATIFSEGIAWVVTENSFPTAINDKGKILASIKDANSVRIFKEGFAAFSIKKDDELKWGFIDKEGKVIITPQFRSSLNYSNGICAVENDSGKWGYIDKTGKVIINFQFKQAGNFLDGVAVVATDNKFGVINTKGNYIINPQFQELKKDGDLFLIKQDDKWGWCDDEGKIIINPQFSEAFPFTSGELAAVKIGESFGYINRDGKIIINPQFELAFPYTGNKALIKASNMIGVIDKEGKYIINPQYEGASNDIFYYLLSDYSLNSPYETVESDYFNTDAIFERIKKDIKDHTVMGLNFNTTSSEFKERFGEYKFNKDTHFHTLVSDEKISKHASVSLSLNITTWLRKYNIYYSRDEYFFIPDNLPRYFEYKVSYSKRNEQIKNKIIKSLREYFNSNGFKILPVEPGLNSYEEYFEAISSSFLIDVAVFDDNIRITIERPEEAELQTKSDTGLQPEELTTIIENEFSKSLSKIEGQERDCWIVNIVSGDLNGDGSSDVVAHYSCGIKGSMGNASTGSGEAIFINKDNQYKIVGWEEKFRNFIPNKIYTGILYGEEVEYAPTDPNCCPSLKREIQLKLVGSNLIKIN